MSLSIPGLLCKAQTWGFAAFPCSRRGTPYSATHQFASSRSPSPGLSSSLCRPKAKAEDPSRFSADMHPLPAACGWGRPQARARVFRKSLLVVHLSLFASFLGRIFMAGRQVPTCGSWGLLLEYSQCSWLSWSQPPHCQWISLPFKVTDHNPHPGQLSHPRVS